MCDSDSEQTSIDFVVAEIKRSLISKREYVKSQNQISDLKLQLQEVKERLKERRKEYEREKLKNDIIIAEKKYQEQWQ